MLFDFGHRIGIRPRLEADQGRRFALPKPAAMEQFPSTVRRSTAADDNSPPKARLEAFRS
jgi:hypothetical protein